MTRAQPVLLRVLLYILAVNATVLADESSAFFSYSELKTLYQHRAAPTELENRLQRLLTRPFVSSSAPEPARAFLQSAKLGEYIRVALWNVERGIQYEALEAIFHSDQRLAEVLDPVKFPRGGAARQAILEQAAALRDADVIVLNEADWGLKRSGYRNIAAELAAKLRMNHAFGVEFIELSPVYLNDTYTNRGDRTEISNLSSLDETKYLGLHGTAILSRFPLENVRLVPFKNQAYDWFGSEKKGPGVIEKARRKLVKEVFLEDALPEVRRGGRMMLIAEIAHASFPAGRATIVATHLEARTSPEKRRLQLEEMLETIRPIPGPVVVAGDMNTSNTDMTPTSLKHELSKRFGKPEYWLKAGLNQILGLGVLEDLAATTLTFGRNHGDPTARHIPILMPNDERKFFSTLKEFRFADRGAFDFRGNPSRSSNGKTNTLANSNERDNKGFVTTSRMERPVLFLGKFKLDWIFVKPVHLFAPFDNRGSYLFAPHFGRTLDLVPSAVKNRISDHSPMIVDLPLAEPAISDVKRKN